MNNNETEVKNLANYIYNTCSNTPENECDDKLCSLCTAKYLMRVGYRKIDEIYEEMVDDIIDTFIKIMKEKGFNDFEYSQIWVALAKTKDSILKKYKIEKDK